MLEKRFACTACGRCCKGSLPITMAEAVKWAHVLPLAISIVPVRSNARGQAIAGRIGTPFKVSKGKDLTLVVSPISFVPPAMPCPHLADDALCAIHDDKPLRCRTMPFNPYKDEGAQSDLLVPKPGWQCETGVEAPVVYRDKKILERGDFDAELNAIDEQQPSMRRLITFTVEHNPVIREQIIGASRSPSGRVVIGFGSLLRFEKALDPVDYARRQRPVLRQWAERTDGEAKLAEFHRFYRQAERELERYGP